MSARTFLVSRRGFLGTAVSGGAFVLGSRLLPAEALIAAGQPAAPAGTRWQPSVYVALEPDGRVVIIAHRSEMGTGIKTALPMVLADELEADWTRVSIVQAVGDKKYGSQNTDGSCSIRDFYEAMRQAGATARLMLERAAAARWNVPATECRARQHAVVHAPSGRQQPFGELVAAAAALPVPAESELTFKPAAERRYVGRNIPVADLEGYTTGTAIFGMDVTVPGMVHASIARPPVLGATLASLDDAATRRVAGVQDVVSLDTITYPVLMKPLGGVAVIAGSTWSALQGRRQLTPTWTPGPHGTFETTAFRDSLRVTARSPQKVVRNGGDVDAALASATRTVEAEYSTPFLAHAPMEPPVAVASVTNGRVEVWAPTQNPQEVQTTVAAALGVKPEDVTCHVTLLGGGFGRKSFPDYCAEAALLSRKVGRPVKVTWTREDDLQSDFYHSAAAMYMKAGLDAGGRPVAWLQRSVFPPIGSTFNEKERYGAGEMSMGWTDVPFDIPNIRAENGPAEAHVRIGWLRSVANIFHAFGVCSFIDELAAAAGADPVEYYLRQLGRDRVLDLSAQGVRFRGPEATPAHAPDTARLRKVVELVADRSGWARRPKGASWGFAAHRSFLSYIATVVEVEVGTDGGVRIPRVHLAVDAGRIVHPDRVTAQFEGAAAFGTSIALFGEVTAADGRITTRNFNDYQVARMDSAPREVLVHLVPSEAAPAGVGEPGVPPIAPAICNAVAAGTGRRVRDLPMVRSRRG